MCYNVLQCVAVCCSVLQCVAVCCRVLQCDVTLQMAGPSFYHDHPFPEWFRLERSALIRETLDLVQVCVGVL